MENIFDLKVTNNFIERVNRLTFSSERLWGTMNVAQMLAHCNVTYELVYDNKHPKPNALVKVMLKSFVKPIVVGDKPYKKSSKTAPMFLIKEEKDFEIEKKRLVEYLQKTQQLGENHFDNKESHSFGKLSKQQWSNMFFKHLDHHLKQFGV